MSYVAPTVADLKAIYPEFSAVGDAVLQNGLNKAGLVVDATWSEAAFPIAYMLYAAHTLVIGGIGSSAIASSFQSGGGIKMRKSGDTAEEFFAPAGSNTGASAAWYDLTRYGKEFAAMLRREFGGPRVYPQPGIDPGGGPAVWPYSANGYPTS